MAAFSFGSATKVRQKVLSSLDTQEKGTTTPSSVGVYYAVKALFLHLAANKANPDLQLIPFSEVQADVASGTVLGTGTCRLYAIYVKKEANDTANTLFIYDDATNAGTAGDAKIGLDLVSGGDVAFAMYPNGLQFADGIVVTQFSDGIGATEGSNGGNGFVIIGSL